MHPLKQLFVRADKCYCFDYFRNFLIYYFIQDIYFTNQILSNLNDGEDFRSLKLVFKRWYSLLHSEQFWKELVIFRFGNFNSEEPGFIFDPQRNSGKSAGRAKRSKFFFSWKVLYLLFAETASIVDLQTKNRNEILSLVDASIHIRKLGPAYILKMLDRLPECKNISYNQNTSNSDLFIKIDYIIRNTYYVNIREDVSRGSYDTDLIIHGLTQNSTNSKRIVSVSLEVGSYLRRLWVSFEKKTVQLYWIEMNNLPYTDYYFFRSNNSLSEISSNVYKAFGEFLPAGVIFVLFAAFMHPQQRDLFFDLILKIESSY